MSKKKTPPLEMLADLHNQLYLGDCLELLKKVPSNSVDSVVTDPPSGIHFMSSDWDKFEKEDPEDDREGMENLVAFQDFICNVFKEVLRVLKPGGHALVWALPRTSHHTAMGLERAGFEIRDRLTHLFSQGMPKSHNISLNIDKHFGATRKATGVYQTPEEGRALSTVNNWDAEESFEEDSTDEEGGEGDSNQERRIPTTSEPVTEEAEHWNGWGTALKPSVEDWWLCRKPLEEETIVKQVLATGTGGINIDGCRVRMGEQDRQQYEGKMHSFKKFEGVHSGGWKNTSPRQSAEQAIENSKLGRWPTNLLLSHDPRCECVDTIKVKAPVINRFTDGAKPFGNGAGHNYETVGGGETTENVYKCVPGCPVAALNKQSGTLTSGGSGKVNKSAKVDYERSSYGKETTSEGRIVHGYADQGGASRFYQTFEPSYEEPFYYCSKITKKERMLDMDGKKNKHPTVKTIKLCRYLCKLITPEKGLVLDPFAGSGSVLVAAVEEGFSFLGFEQHEPFYQFAQTRTRNTLLRAKEREELVQAFHAQDDLPQELVFPCKYSKTLILEAKNLDRPNKNQLRVVSLRLLALHSI